MPRYILIDDSGDLHDEIFDSADEAAKHLEDEVKNGNVSADKAEEWSACRLTEATMEVEVTVNVTIY